MDASTRRRGHKNTLSDLCYDILLLICDHLEHLRGSSETPIKCLSQTNRRLRTLLAPWLFKTLHISVPVKLLPPSPLHIIHAQKLKVDMFGAMWWWCLGVYVSDTDAADLFRLIRSLEALHTLEVRMLRSGTEIFQTAFQRPDNHLHEFLLHRVQKLVGTSSAVFLATHCPNLKSLIIQDGDDSTMQMYLDLNSRLTAVHPDLCTGLNTYLSHLDASATWSVDEIILVMTTFPDLEQLCMRSEACHYQTPLNTVVELLGSGLKKLKTLKLTQINNLDFGFRPVMWMMIQRCQSELHRKRLWRDREIQRVKAENDMARMVFAAIQSLGKLWIGEGRVASRIRGNENVYGMNLEGEKWMWRRDAETRRVRECVRGATDDRAERDAVMVRSEIGM